MSYKIFILTLITAGIFFSCSQKMKQSGANSEVMDSLKQVASSEGFEPFKDNPVMETGSKGSFDAGALGSMTVVKANGIFHMYYEAWGKRSDKMWDAAEYETLQIGHATSKDGIHWKKDPNNPVLEQGDKGDWDATGVWDPYVIYEDGKFKMWYGGGGGRKPNYGWAYAVSKDGSNFDKKGLIGKGNQSGVEDVHLVHDEESGLYYMYYWHGWEGGEDLFYVTSPTETDFNFNEAGIIEIEGDQSFWCKFGQVVKNDEGWHMFYSNYIPPHGRNSIVRYATSDDGVHWEAQNKRLLYGLDAEVLQVTEDLFMMTYAPENHFDKNDADIRLAFYNGRLSELASKEPYIKVTEPNPIEGRKFTANLGADGLHRFHFKKLGEVIITDLGDDENYQFCAYYEQDGKNVHIKGEGINMKGIYQEGSFQLKKKSN